MLSLGDERGTVSWHLSDSVLLRCTSPSYGHVHAKAQIGLRSSSALTDYSQFLSPGMWSGQRACWTGEYHRCLHFTVVCSEEPSSFVWLTGLCAWVLEIPDLEQTALPLDLYTKGPVIFEVWDNDELTSDFLGGGEVHLNSIWREGSWEPRCLAEVRTAVPRCVELAYTRSYH